MVPDFYNENLYRAFPFQVNTVNTPGASVGTIEALPNTIIVDAGFISGASAGFVTAIDTIWLDSIHRSGDFFSFNFKSSAIGLWGKLLTFTRGITDLPYATEYIDENNAGGVTSDSLFSDSLNCEPESLWSGYLVTGDMADLAAILSDGNSLTRSTGGLIEPTLTQNLAGSFVNSFNLANNDRMRVAAPAGCPPVEYAYPTGETYVNADCLQGRIRFKAGYNAVVRQSASANSITLSAEVGAGEGQPCSEVKLFATESPPAGSQLLEGGPGCNEVIRAINGISGTLSSLIEGTGVQITQLPSQSTIIIDVNMNELAMCFSAGSYSDVSESL